MDAIQKIIDEIDQKAKASRDHHQAEELAKIDQWYQEELAKITTAHEKQLKKQMQDLTQKFKQAKSRQQMEIRQESLVEKQGYLDRLFTEAYEEMASWPKEKVQAFAKGNLSQLPITEAAELLPSGKQTQLALDEEFVAEIANKLSYPIHLGAAQDSLEEGFVVDVSGIQYNFLYRDLLKELRTTAGNEMTQKLFG